MRRSALPAAVICAARSAGAFFFGWLTDRLGRKKLFTITLAVYLLATAATGLSWDASSFILFRILTGAGIGGEYTAINSTIQELIPARFRGWTDLLINGSFWVGAAIGAGGSLVLLNPALINPAIGWRLAFLIGATIGLVILRDATLDSGKPALAGDARHAASGRRRRARHRSAIRPQRSSDARAKNPAAHARPHAACRGRPRAVSNLSPTHAGRL